MSAETHEALARVRALLNTPPEGEGAVLLSEDECLDALTDLAAVRAELARMEGALSACEERCLKLVGGIKAQILEWAIDSTVFQFRSDDVADALGYSRPHVDNELKALTDLGLLRRFRDDPPTGGRRYSYRLPAAPEQRT